MDALKDHLRLAHIIIEERNLHDIWEYIPKSDDPEFKNDSFEEYVRQGINFSGYTEWSDSLEEIFFQNKLDFLRFKTKTRLGDARKTNNSPAYVFLKQAKELDEIIVSPQLLESYRTSEAKQASWQVVRYKDGVITQGNKTHTFNEGIYVKLFDYLWERRRTESPTGSELFTPEKPISREELNEELNIKDHARFTAIITGVRKAMKKKEISLRVLYPNNVYIVVRQLKR